MTSDAQKPSSRNDSGRAEGLSFDRGLDYGIIFNAASNGMAFTEFSSGRILDVNAAWIRSTGIVREQAIGRTAFELGLWASQADREACLAALDKKGRFVDFEARLMMKSAELPHLISGEIVEMDGKRYVLWEFRDITEQRRMHEVLIKGEEKVKSLLAASEQSRQVLLSILEDEKRAKEALRQSEARIKSISNNFTAGMIYQIVIHPDGTRKFTYLSDAVQQLYGISPEEGMADATLIYRRIHADDIEFLTEAEDEAVKTCSTFKAEVRMKDPSGEIRWSSFISTPQRLEDGSTCFDGIEFIITERKQAEDALRESEQRLSSFMDSASDSFYLLDSDLRFVEINPRGLEIAGRKKEDIIGKSITEIVPDVVKSGRYERHQEVLRTGKPFVVEDFIPHPVFGDMHFILKSFKVGNGLGVIAADITERKQAEEELRASEKQYREQQVFLESIYHGVDSAIFVIDVTVDGDFRYAGHNKAHQQGMGLKSEDFIGKIPEDLIPHIPPDVAASVRANYQRCVDVGKTLEYDEKLTIGNQDLWLLTRLTPLKDERGRIYRMIGISADITDRKRMEEELRQHREHLEDLVKERTAELETKTQELETFNKAMVNRELRIIELKEEINRLCAELGREPKYPPVWRDA
jgi:PAS domain S-box-containing protein